MNAQTLDTETPTLADLLTEIRETAKTDIEFAQRIALVCCALIEQKADPLAAIWAVFAISERVEGEITTPSSPDAPDGTPL